MKELLNLPAAYDGAASFYTRRSGDRVVHCHDELELNLVVRGRAAYLVDDRKYQLRLHTGIWFFAEQEHILLDESPDFAMWIIVWKPALISRLCTAADRRILCDPDPPGEFCRSFDRDRSERLQALFGELAEARDDAERLNAGLGYALLAAWAAHQTANEVTGTDVHPAVETAARLLRDEPVFSSVEELARRSGLSASRLSHLFKEQTGVSLVEFKNKQCLERFLGLYGRGYRYGMSEAAADAGFGSYAQFHRVFKRWMGCSPAQYRQQLLQQGL